MEMLGLSRHNFEKAQNQGLIQGKTIDGTKGKEIVVYSISN